MYSNSLAFSCIEYTAWEDIHRIYIRLLRNLDFYNMKYRAWIIPLIRQDLQKNKLELGCAKLSQVMPVEGLMEATIYLDILLAKYV